MLWKMLWKYKMVVEGRAEINRKVSGHALLWPELQKRGVCVRTCPRHESRGTAEEQTVCALKTLAARVCMPVR